ncbi:hypothetical protein T484DRAFT_1757204 [Baffinella frigidus]|nr:hypothetical protein T484DRAFT_1757204 [Cryptophyta sp. CCMP2293]
MVKALDLPGHYKTEIVVITPTNTARSFDAAAAFFSLLDELKVELEESPDNEGFYHNRSSLLKAYGENRMYGLCAYWSKEMMEHKSLDDPIFVTNKHNMIHRILPCFLVLEKEWDGEDSVCTHVWTAKRARNKGMAKYLLDTFDVRSADLPLPEAEAFWAKHFARVQAELDENE